MYKTTTPLFLICETPLHAGSGDDLGIVDLPIQRERHTSFPKIESSSLKGALREAFESESDKRDEFKDLAKQLAFNQTIHRVFGYDSAFEKQIKKEEDIEKIHNSNERNKQNLLRGVKDFFADNSDFSGCLAVTDARLLLFPVKSMKGVFVWITCPQVLNRLATDLKIAGKTPFQQLETAKILEITEGVCFVANAQSVTFGNNVLLEEFAFAATENATVTALAAELADKIFQCTDLTYWNGKLKTNLVVLNNNDFKDFVNLSTEVITRTKIDNRTGTVDKDTGALFTEEFLPNDSVMYSLVMFSAEYSKNTDKMTVADVEEFFKKNKPNIFQLGGNASIGKGLLRTQIVE